MVEALNASQVARVIVLGDYPDDACGDTFIYALPMLREAAPDSPPPTLACDGSVNAPTGTPANMPWHRMPDSEENAVAARSWVASAAPLYRLHPGATDVASLEPAAPEPGALWSAPFPIDVALRLGQRVEITIVAAVEHPNGTEVVLSTPLSGMEDPRFPDDTLKLFFECGDARLREVGTSWYAVMVRTDPYQGESDPFDTLARGKAFLVPGLLLPRRQSYWTVHSELHRPPQ